MVADMGFGLPPGMAVRTSLVATALARTADLGEHDVRDAFYTGLLLHVGCVAVAHESAAAFGDDIALNRAVARTNLADPNDIMVTFVPEMTRGMTPHAAARARAFALSHEVYEWGYRTDTGVCEVARDTARGLGLPSSIQLALYHVFESWVGGAAPGGLQGDSIPIASRVARVAVEAAFFSHLGGVDASIAAVRARAGMILDPTLAETFVANARNLVAEAERGDPRHLLLEVEPAPVIEVDGAERVAVARAFGELADVKVPYLHGHANEVTRLTLGAARRLGLAEAEIAHLELAALLHDVGRVGVSNAVWEKPGPLTSVEWEQVRMHGYYTERILAASPSLDAVATMAGMHHERLDGSGYHRCSAAAAIPMPVRILSAADAFAAMVRTRPQRAALDDDEAAAVLTNEAQAGRFDHDATAAVLAEAGQQTPVRPRALPAGLTEREAGVLTLIAQGCSNAEVGQRLFISRRTAEHHAQHIYTKIGVSTRAAAALFAVQHGLVSLNR